MKVIANENEQLHRALHASIRVNRHENDANKIIKNVKSQEIPEMTIREIVFVNFLFYIYFTPSNHFSPTVLKSDIMLVLILQELPIFQTLIKTNRLFLLLSVRKLS